MAVFRIVPVLITVLVLAATCNGCYTNYQLCYVTFSNVTAPSGSNTTIYCSAAETAVTCFKNDTSNCTGSESVPAMYTTYLQSLENITSSCVQNVNCTMKLMTCATPALAGNCGNFSNGISTDDQIKCCGYGKTAIDCLKEANCLDIPNHLRILESNCHGYEDYCPGLSLCVDAVKTNGGLNNINNLCTFEFSCIT